MDRTSNPRQLALLCALLAGVTLATFWPVLDHGFINYDDPDYVTENDWVKRGLTWDGLQWVFTTNHASNWHPVTWLSHMLDVQWFGLEASRHHLTNLLFHTANSVLLLLLLWQMTGAVRRSALVAALFSLHPLHVESVAWVAERKDVLSAFFGLLCLIAYGRYVSGIGDQMSRTRVSTWLWYGAAFVLLALGLMSKPMLVTWPLVMLLLDFWPLGRVTSDAWRVTGGTWRRLAIEKLPFLLLVAVSGFVTLAVQQDAMSTTEGLPVGERLGNASIACVAYLKQTFWPAGLSVFYPFVRPLAASQWIVATILLSIITVLVLRSARRQPFALVGWVWYLITLLPVIGIAQVGAQARADRYTYLPLIGIFILLVWIAAQLPLLHSRARIASGVMAIAMVVTLALQTRDQLQHWRDSESLFAHAARVTQRNFIAWAGLGIVEYRRGSYELAAQNLKQALEYAPPGKPADQIKFYLGATLQKQARGREALPFLEEALMVGTLEPERNYRLGLSLLEVGRTGDAEAALQLACNAKPEESDFQLGMAALLVQQGRTADAGLLLTNVVSSNSEKWLAQSTLAEFLLQQGQPQEAEAPFAKAVSLSPNDARLRQAHARCLIALGKLDPARRELEQALELRPQEPQICFELAEMLATTGQTRRALELYEQAIRASPNHIPALNNLAWLLATHPEDSVRDGKRAVELAQKACELTDWKQAVLMGTLAAAYAEMGDFVNAVQTAERAHNRALEDNQENIAKENETLLKLYRDRRPYREGKPSNMP